MSCVCNLIDSNCCTSNVVVIPIKKCLYICVVDGPEDDDENVLVLAKLFVCLGVHC